VTIGSSDSRLIDGAALWCERLTARASNGRPALFCDRDGVIVEEVGYLGKPDDVSVIPAAVSLIRAANDRGIRVVVVTNQSGIGRGYYGWADFAAVQDRIVEELARSGAEIDLVVASAHHEEGRGPFASEGHEWRKPGPGMILLAREKLDVGLPGSLIVGDKLSDLQAGQAAGIGNGLLVRTGHGESAAKDFSRASFDRMKVEIASDAAGALPWLTSLA
jgi:D-glycero-D-manno-heptose 1,7-bisphosphate phosphatase